jgi:hypothetical protein
MVFGVKIYFCAHIYIDILRISMSSYMEALVCRGICSYAYMYKIVNQIIQRRVGERREISQLRLVFVYSLPLTTYINSTAGGRRFEVIGYACA